MSVSDLFPTSYRVIIDASPVLDGPKPRMYDLPTAIRECNRRAVIAECHAAVENYEGLIIYQSLVDINSSSAVPTNIYIDRTK